MIRTLALTTAILFSCVPPPIIPPNPEPNIPAAPESVEFCGWGVQVAERNVANEVPQPISLIVPPSAGNSSKIEGQQVTIISSTTTAGWVCSKAKVALNNYRLSVKVILPSWDCSMSISPTRNLQSTNGLFGEPSRLRLTMYSLPKYFWTDWKRAGMREERQLSPTGQEPFYISMSFVNDSVRFERSIDGINWQQIARDKFSLPGYTLVDSFFVELQANKTPTGGQFIASGLQVESLSTKPEDPPPAPPVMLEANSAIVAWLPNTEPDLLGYTLWLGRQSRQYETGIDVGLATEYKLIGLAHDTLYYFAVTAYDTAGNRSAFSAEVSARTPKDPEPEPEPKPDSTLIHVQGNSFALICVKRNMRDTSGVAFDSLDVRLYGELAEPGASVPLQFYIPADESFPGVFRIDVAGLRNEYGFHIGDTLAVLAIQVNRRNEQAGNAARMNKRFLF